MSEANFILRVKYRPKALELHDRYGFGATIISRMLAVDYLVKVSDNQIQHWLTAERKKKQARS